MEDCFRLHASKWRCSAGTYPGDAGSNGYTIATEPYLPGTAYTFLTLAVDGGQPHARAGHPHRAVELWTFDLPRG